MENGFRKSKNGFISFFTGSSMHKRKYTDDFILKMKNMKLSGMTYKEIGIRLNLSSTNVQKLISIYNPIIDDIDIPDNYVTIKMYAELNGMTYSAVYYYIKKYNIETIKKNHKLYLDKDIVFTYNSTLKDEDIETIIELSNRGHTVSDIRKITGFNRKTISYYTDGKTTKHRNINKYNKVKELHNSGYSIRKIAKELNIPFGSIHYMLKKFDI